MTTEMTVQQAKDALKNLPETATWVDREKAEKDLYNAYLRDKNTTLEELDDDEDGSGGGSGGGNSGAAPTKRSKRPK